LRFSSGVWFWPPGTGVAGQGRIEDLEMHELPAGAVGNEHFSQILTSLAVDVNVPLELGAVTQALGRRSFGALMLFFALPMVLPIPMPGISVLFGIPLFLISGQLFLGFQSVWLPARLARQVIAPANLTKYVDKAMPALRKVESVLRPRFPFMAGECLTKFIGAASLLLALIIILPVPLGHLLPGAAISFMALGLIERDGVAVGAGLAIGIVALVVIALAVTGLAALGRSML
jgi:hypothetical protein